MPLSRWPSQGRHALVLLQQAAVNLATQELALVVSVNGPPGTGQLCSVMLLLLYCLGIAKALSALKIRMTRLSMLVRCGLVLCIYISWKKVRGHEIVVASTNNKAVENISKELPLRENSEDIEKFGYFSAIVTHFPKMATRHGD